MTDTKTVVMAAAIVLAAVIITAALIVAYAPRIHSHGTVKTVGVGVYSDAYATITVTEINWGNLAPGDVAQQAVYVKNTGNTLGILNFNTTSWQPPGAAQYFTLAWSAQNFTVGPTVILYSTFTLTVSPAVTGVTSFDFDINVWLQA